MRHKVVKSGRMKLVLIQFAFNYLLRCFITAILQASTEIQCCWVLPPSL